MEQSPHIIDADAVQKIRSTAAAAEKMGTLHPEQLSLIYNRKWFNLYVPEDMGGLALSLPEGLRREEALAWADGSFGWTVTLCSGANWFIGFLDPGLREELFQDKQVCLAGSGQPSGIAKITKDGFEISGTWKYATGAPHATAFTANCVLQKDGKDLTDQNGRALVQAFLFRKDEVVVHDDWKAFGMVATASRSFSVHGLKVSASRSFTIDPSRAVLPDAIYRYPFGPFAETTLAVNSSGMAYRFVELAEEIIRAKSISLSSSFRNLLDEQVAIAKTNLDKLRLSFFRVADRSWLACEKDSLSQESIDEVSHLSRALANGSRVLVDALYPFCGLTAANPMQEINRVWRNLHTASQHSLLLFPQA